MSSSRGSSLWLLCALQGERTCGGATSTTDSGGGTVSQANVALREAMARRHGLKEVEAGSDRIRDPYISQLPGTVPVSEAAAEVGTFARSKAAQGPEWKPHLSQTGGGNPVSWEVAIARVWPPADLESGAPVHGLRERMIAPICHPLDPGAPGGDAGCRRTATSGRPMARGTRRRWCAPPTRLEEAPEGAVIPNLHL